MSSPSWQQLSERMLRQAGLALDWSRMNIPPSFFEEMTLRIQNALKGMRDLEKGARVNESENRRVGHYWLRGRGNIPSPPDEPDIEAKIKKALDGLKAFAHGVVGKSAEVKTQGGKRFKNFLLIGIGGSALGPQLLADALGPPGRGYLSPYFFDNTDPDGIDRTLEQIGSGLSETLTIVISKSGTTPETLNGLAEAAHAYRTMDLDFAQHAVAVSIEGKDGPLLERAGITNWRKHFPIWDWVGGRTSLTSAVGLLPAALMGIPIDKILQGAAEMDDATRGDNPRENMALLLALCWHHATNGRGEKDMVILPYKDRLILFSRYLQQLIMESLGKEKVHDGVTTHQGIAVYGNKGSTDQHSYVQQLRDGVPNFFVTFLQVLKDREGPSLQVDPQLPGITSGDFLLGFLLGTRQALFEKGRESLTITLDELTPRTLGSLVALYERAVGYYAGLVEINAYDQPGVAAGKEAAKHVVELQKSLLDALPALPEKFTAEQAAAAIPPLPVPEGQERRPVDVETVWKILEHLALNSANLGCRRGNTPAGDEFFKKS